MDISIVVYALIALLLIAMFHEKEWDAGHYISVFVAWPAIVFITVAAAIIFRNYDDRE